MISYAEMADMQIERCCRITVRSLDLSIRAMLYSLCQSMENVHYGNDGDIEKTGKIDDQR